MHRLVELASTTGVPLSQWLEAWEAAEGDTRLFDNAVAFWPAMPPPDAVRFLRSLLGPDAIIRAAPAVPIVPLHADVAQRCQTAAAEQAARRHLISTL